MYLQLEFECCPCVLLVIDCSCTAVPQCLQHDSTSDIPKQLESLMMVLTPHLPGPTPIWSGHKTIYSKERNMRTALYLSSQPPVHRLCTVALVTYIQQ